MFCEDHFPVAYQSQLQELESILIKDQGQSADVLGCHYSGKTRLIEYFCKQNNLIQMDCFDDGNGPTLRDRIFDSLLESFRSRTDRGLIDNVRQQRSSRRNRGYSEQDLDNNEPIEIVDYVLLTTLHNSLKHQILWLAKIPLNEPDFNFNYKFVKAVKDIFIELVEVQDQFHEPARIPSLKIPKLIYEYPKLVNSSVPAPRSINSGRGAPTSSPGYTNQSSGDSSPSQPKQIKMTGLYWAYRLEQRRKDVVDKFFHHAIKSMESGGLGWRPRTLAESKRIIKLKRVVKKWVGGYWGAHFKVLSALEEAIAIPGWKERLFTVQDEQAVDDLIQEALRNKYDEGDIYEFLNRLQRSIPNTISLCHRTPTENLERATLSSLERHGLIYKISHNENQLTQVIRLIRFWCDCSPESVAHANTAMEEFRSFVPQDAAREDRAKGLVEYLYKCKPNTDQVKQLYAHVFPGQNYPKDLSDDLMETRVNKLVESCSGDIETSSRLEENIIKFVVRA